jgi:hypothetical protein
MKYPRIQIVQSAVTLGTADAPMTLPLLASHIHLKNHWKLISDARNQQRRAVNAA